VSGNDTKQSTGLLAPLPFAVGAVFLLFGSMGLILTIDVALGLIAGLVLVLVVAIDTVGSWFAFQQMERVQRNLGHLSTVAHESFDGALTVRALGREQEESARFGATSEALRDALVASAARGPRSARSPTSARRSARSASSRSRPSGRRGRVEPGDLVTIAYLLSLLVVPHAPHRLPRVGLGPFGRRLAPCRRVLDVTTGSATATASSPRVGMGTGGAAVRVEGVRFAYAADQPVLDGVDLDAPPGAPTRSSGRRAAGSRRSPACSPGCGTPTRGRILLDGVDLRDLAPGVVPAQVAYVPRSRSCSTTPCHGNITLGDDASTTRPSRRACGSHASTRSSRGCPTGSRPASASVARRCRAASSSVSVSPGRSPAARG
jgi:ATP-binding cassette, subfamily B, bacterial